MTVAADAAARTAPGAASVHLWYERSTTWLGLCVLSVLPFLFATYPPLGDIYNHIGRYYIMVNYDHVPLLQRYYTYRWQIIPNLGQDLLVYLLHPFLPVDRAAFAMAAAIPPLMILAFRQLSIAVHGRVQPIALLALPFTYSFTYLYGFMNYHTGIVLLLWGAVFWFRSRGWRPAPRYAMLFLLGALVWVAHLSAWALFVIAIGCFELTALRGARVAWPRAVFEAGLRAVPAALPGVYTLVQAVLHPGPAGEPGGFMRFFWLKFYWLVFVLRDESKVLDLASLLIVGAIPAILLLRRRATLFPGLALWAGLVLALFWIIPTALMGGFYADLRLLVVVWIAVLLSIGVKTSPRWCSMIALGAVLLFGVRIAVTSVRWHERSRDIATELAAIDRIPMGARIAEFAPLRTCGSWPNESVGQLAALAILRRHAFSNTEWRIPGQQPMQPTYLASSRYGSAYYYSGKAGRCSGTKVGDWLAKFPRDSFDYVWLFGEPDAGRAVPWLRLVHRGPQGGFYEIRRPDA